MSDLTDSRHRRMTAASSLTIMTRQTVFAVSEFTLGLAITILRNSLGICLDLGVLDWIAVSFHGERGRADEPQHVHSRPKLTPTLFGSRCSAAQRRCCRLSRLTLSRRPRHHRGHPRRRFLRPLWAQSLKR